MQSSKHLLRARRLDTLLDYNRLPTVFVSQTIEWGKWDRKRDISKIIITCTSLQNSRAEPLAIQFV